MGKKCWIALGVLCALLPGWTVPASAVQVPEISAACAVLMDGDSGRVLYAKGENEERPIASITKLMTALVAAEYTPDLSKHVTIRQEWTQTEGTSLYLKTGEDISLETLLYGLLLHSGNDAALALAGCCGGKVETFVDWMNVRAADLGMTHTHFSNPNGLSDENHYSSALDMAKLAAACLKNATVSAIAGTKSITLEGRTFTNHNKLLWQYEGCIGMKTGYTKLAGRTLVSSARRDGQTLICVTLGDPDDWRDHKALLDYGFEACPRRVLAEEGALIRRLPVEGSLLPAAAVVVRDTLAYPLQEGEEPETEIDLPERGSAPLQAGEIAGTLRYTLRGKTLAEGYLIWASSVHQDVVAEKTVKNALEFLKNLGKKPILDAFAQLEEQEAN